MKALSFSRLIFVFGLVFGLIALCGTIAYGCVAQIIILGHILQYML